MMLILMILKIWGNRKTANVSPTTVISDTYMTTEFWIKNRLSNIRHRKFAARGACTHETSFPLSRWCTRTFFYIQFWPSIFFLVIHLTSHHVRTLLPTPYPPHMKPPSNRHMWRHQWRKVIFGFCFCEWRWVIFLKCCQYGSKRQKINWTKM